MWAAVDVAKISRMDKNTVTLNEIDKKARTVTNKGPEGNTEVVKAKDARNLDAIKPGDLVEITYILALSIPLDKPERK